MKVFSILLCILVLQGCSLYNFEGQRKEQAYKDRMWQESVTKNKDEWNGSSSPIVSGRTNPEPPSRKNDGVSANKIEAEDTATQNEGW
jgi:hypothetical protein